MPNAGEPGSDAWVFGKYSDSCSFFFLVLRKERIGGVAVAKSVSLGLEC